MSARIKSNRMARTDTAQKSGLIKAVSTLGTAFLLNNWFKSNKNTMQTSIHNRQLFNAIKIQTRLPVFEGSMKERKQGTYIV